MISFETERLIACSNMVLNEGELCEGIIPDLEGLEVFLNDKYRKEYQLSNSFVFFDKNRIDVPICYISYFKKRDRYELHWETLEQFKKQGYMTEALTAFAKWMKENTEKEVLWALIDSNNVPSLKMAQKCGFGKTEDNITGTNWYKLLLVNELDGTKEVF